MERLGIIIQLIDLPDVADVSSGSSEHRLQGTCTLPAREHPIRIQGTYVCRPLLKPLGFLLKEIVLSESEKLLSVTALVPH